MRVSVCVRVRVRLCVRACERVSGCVRAEVVTEVSVGGWVQRFHCDATHEHFAAANADPSHRLYMCPHVYVSSYY